MLSGSSDGFASDGALRNSLLKELFLFGNIMPLTSELLEVPTLTETEQVIIANTLSSPTIKKYLRIMAQNDIIELATISTSEKDDSTIARKHATVQGKLAVLQTLLSIQPKE